MGFTGWSVQVFMTDECLVIVMEYASGGPLQDRIRTSGRLPEAEAKKFFSQLVDGISYCHAQVRTALPTTWQLHTLVQMWPQPCHCCLVPRRCCRPAHTI